MIEKVYVALIAGTAGALFFALPGFTFSAGNMQSRAKKYGKIFLLMFSLFSVLALVGLLLSDGRYYTDEESDAYDRAIYNR